MNLKPICGTLALMVAINVFATTHNGNTRAEDQLYSLSNSDEFLSYRKESISNNYQYKDCVVSWDKVRVLGEFFSCINPDILIKKIADNGGSFIRIDSDNDGYLFVEYTSDTIFEGSERLVIGATEQNVFSISFLFSEDDAMERFNSLKGLMRQMAKFYGEPEMKRETYKSSGYLWNLDKKVTLEMKTTEQGFIVQFYDKKLLNEALRRHLLK